MQRNPRPTDAAIHAYSQAAAHACIIELKARMFGDVVPMLRCFARGNLFLLMTAITQWMAVNGRGTVEERARLLACVTLRNKLLHADLSRAALHAKNLGATLNEGTVVSIAVARPVTAESLLSAIDDRSKHVPVAGTDSKHVPVFGWLLESMSSGVFTEATRIFSEAIWFLERQAEGLTDEDTRETA